MYKTWQCFNVLLSNFGEPEFWANWAGPLLLWPLCFKVPHCLFRNETFFVTNAATVAFLSSPSNPSILFWPLRSTLYFYSHICRSLDIFSFLDHSLYRWLCVKIPVKGQFLKYTDCPVWYQKPCLLPHFGSLFELQKVFFTMFTSLNKLSCCRVIGWLSTHLHQQATCNPKGGRESLGTTGSAFRGVKRDMR